MGSWTQTRTVASSTRSTTTCCRSAAARLTCRATLGGPSSSHTPPAAGHARRRTRRSAGSGYGSSHCPRPQAVPPAMSTIPRWSRERGSAGHDASSAAMTARRYTPSRNARAASSSAMRRTRSDTTTPSGCHRPQPSRRNAIQPLARQVTPIPTDPTGKHGQVAPHQCAKTTSSANCPTRPASHPTRCANTRPDTNTATPGASGLPPHAARNAVHVAVDISPLPATTRHPRLRPPAAGAWPPGTGYRTSGRRMWPPKT